MIPRSVSSASTSRASRTLDGLRFLEAARVIAARGGTVVLYRAGRTAAGASASASHTAAIAGDALITSALARQAGVIVAETLEAFDDLVRTLVLLDGKAVAGPRLGAMSNAGFECVAIADNLGALSAGAVRGDDGVAAPGDPRASAPRRHRRHP